MKRLLFYCMALGLAAGGALAQPQTTNAAAVKNSDALRNAVIFIIRHAEKPATGMELTPAGVARANAYTNYFRNFIFDSKPLRLDYLFATTDSKNSQRPRLTTEPLSRALGMALDTRFTAKDVQGLADEIQSKPHGHQILICWHHGDIPPLITALGGDPSALLPGGKWPDDVFSWMIELRYDQNGRLNPSETKCLNEKLMPGDDAKVPPSGKVAEKIN